MSARARWSSARTSSTRIPRERSSSRSFRRFTSASPYGSRTRSNRPSAIALRARAASAHQNARCHITSRTAQPSAFIPGRSTSAGGTASVSATNASQPSASARRSSSRRAIALPFREVLERDVADHDLVAPPGARRGELAFDPLLHQPALEALELLGIVEVGLGHPTLDAATDHTEALTLPLHQ